jgi:hypothetical protein
MAKSGRRGRKDIGRMTAAEFNELFAAEVLRLRRRLHWLRTLQQGTGRVRRVWVSEHTVPRHSVRGHWRLVADGRDQ